MRSVALVSSVVNDLTSPISEVRGKEVCLGALPEGGMRPGMETGASRTAVGKIVLWSERLRVAMKKLFRLARLLCPSFLVH